MPARDTEKSAPARLGVTFWLDVALLVSVCALETVPFTGLVLHEWLGLALIAMLVVHLLLSWTWIASTTRRLLAVESNRTRVNYLLNLSLFACMTAVILSGILISQEAISTLTGNRAVAFDPRPAWAAIHDRFSNFVVVLAALHLAMNWDWSVAAARKILRGRKAGAL